MRPNGNSESREQRLSITNNQDYNVRFHLNPTYMLLHGCTPLLVEVSQVSAMSLIYYQFICPCVNCYFKYIFSEDINVQAIFVALDRVCSRNDAPALRSLYRTVDYMRPWFNRFRILYSIFNLVRNQ